MEKKRPRKKNYYRDRKDSAGQVVGRLPPNAKHIPAHIMAEKRKAKMKQRLLDLAPKCTSDRQLIKAAGVGIATFYKYKRTDDEFAKALEHAKLPAQDLIREEIANRAIHGYLKPVVSAGKLVTYERVKSDGLLTLLAKAHLNEYRNDGASFSAAGLMGAADRLRARFATILERRRTRGAPGPDGGRGSTAVQPPLAGVGEKGTTSSE